MKKKSKKASEGIFHSLRRERVADGVAKQLKNVIRQGIYRPGDRLPSERELAEQMGVSRPSIREAIQQLELQGMVEPIHGDGTVVKNLTEQEIAAPLEAFVEDDRYTILELTEVRACLESWAARLAALNHTEEDLEKIRDQLDSMEAHPERLQVGAAVDLRFHIEIAAASHNRILLHVMQSIHDLVLHSMKVHRGQVLVEPEHQENLLAQHLRIFETIRCRDPEEAGAAMMEHLRFVIENYRRKFFPDDTEEQVD